MNKNELIAKVAEETQLTKADCQRVIEATLDLTKKTLKKGDEVRLVGEFARALFPRDQTIKARRRFGGELRVLVYR